MTNQFFRKVLSCCSFTLNISPVILLSFILIWAFWAYHRMCLYLIQNDAILQGCLYMIFFEPFFVLLAWSFYKASRTSPGNTTDGVYQDETEFDIEQGYQDQDSEHVQLLPQSQLPSKTSAGHLDNSVGDYNEVQNADNINNQDANSSIPAILSLDNNNSSTSLATPSSLSITVKRDGGKRYCQKCKRDKADRSHHCRSCKRCILKMDHHCPWINNCVGFYNYKFFYLFIVYGALFCIYVFSTTLPPTIHVMQQPMGIFEIDFNWLFLCFVSVVFGLFLIPFSLFHTRQLCKNRTTIEFYEKANYRLGSKQKRMGSRRQMIDIMRSRYFNPWELNTRANIEQVLGKSLVTWFLPIGLPSGNGYNFPLNAHAYDTLAIDEDEDAY